MATITTGDVEAAQMAVGCGHRVEIKDEPSAAFALIHAFDTPDGERFHAVAWEPDVPTPDISAALEYVLRYCDSAIAKGGAR